MYVIVVRPTPAPPPFSSYSCVAKLGDITAVELYRMTREQLKEIVGLGTSARLYSQLQRDRAKVGTTHLHTCMHIHTYLHAHTNCVGTEHIRIFNCSTHQRCLALLLTQEPQPTAFPLQAESMVSKDFREVMKRQKTKAEMAQDVVAKWKKSSLGTVSICTSPALLCCSATNVWSLYRCNLRAIAEWLSNRLL